MNARKSTKSGRSRLGELRRCWKCQLELPKSEFSKDESRKSGLQSKCKGCSNRSVSSWRKQKGDTFTREVNGVPAEPRVTRKKQTSSGIWSHTKNRLEEQRLRQDGLNVRNRMHLSTKQLGLSRSIQSTQRELEREADSWLKMAKD